MATNAGLLSENVNLAPLFDPRLLTFMLLVGRVVYPHWDQDEEDEKRPDDLDQQLDLKEGRQNK